MLFLAWRVDDDSGHVSGEVSKEDGLTPRSTWSRVLKCKSQKNFRAGAAEQFLSCSLKHSVPRCTFSNPRGAKENPQGVGVSSVMPGDGQSGRSCVRTLSVTPRRSLASTVNSKVAPIRSFCKMEHNTAERVQEDHFDNCLPVVARNSAPVPITTWCSEVEEVVLLRRSQEMGKPDPSSREGHPESDDQGFEMKARVGGTCT
ncbi:hypothetical protein BDZ91DRAFT_762654 [Kalaharituber pfeilii]|nr:hypothetical protein BDZ91DRAFT_762654 [Kalaharituber pfeilii]